MVAGTRIWSEERPVGGRDRTLVREKAGWWPRQDAGQKMNGTLVAGTRRWSEKRPVGGRDKTLVRKWSAGGRDKTLV